MRKKKVFFLFLTIAPAMFFLLGLENHPTSPEPTAPTKSRAQTAPSGAAPRVPETKVVARIGNYELSVKDLVDLSSKYPRQFRSLQSFEGRKNLVENLIHMKLFSLAAEREGMEKDPEVQKQMQNYREQILSSAYYNYIARAVTVSDEEAKQYYDSYPNEFTTPEQARVKHILVRTEDEAKTIKAELDKGANFEDLARQKSIDKASAARRGDLGWYTRGSRGETFDKAVSTLEPGKVSDPIKTSSGYHLIKVEEKRLSTLRDFEKERPRILKMLKAQKERQSVDDAKKKLRSEIGVFIDEEVLKSMPLSPETPQSQPR